MALDSRTTISPRLITTVKSLLSEVCKKSIVKLAWIPSHIGIKGNDEADSLAKAATNHPVIDIIIKKDLECAYHDIKGYVINKWQQHYDSANTGIAHKQLEPVVSKRIKYTCVQRSKEVLISRLRLGRCRLASYLHAIGCHPDGLCNLCNKPETISHLLLECTKYNIAAELSDACKRLNLQPTVNNLLTSSELIDNICKLVNVNKLSL
jgi:hypothetical protein